MLWLVSLLAVQMGCKTHHERSVLGFPSIWPFLATSTQVLLGLCEFLEEKDEQRSTAKCTCSEPEKQSDFGVSLQTFRRSVYEPG